MVSLYLQSPKYEGGSLTNSGFGQLGCGLEINYEKPIQNSDHTHVTVQHDHFWDGNLVRPPIGVPLVICVEHARVDHNVEVPSVKIHDLGGMGK